eukprot:13917196-Heterocapsa_arctica.AAC.1
MRRLILPRGGGSLSSSVGCLPFTLRSRPGVRLRHLLGRFEPLPRPSASVSLRLRAARSTREAPSAVAAISFSILSRHRSLCGREDTSPLRRASHPWHPCVTPCFSKSACRRYTLRAAEGPSAICGGRPCASPAGRSMRTPIGFSSSSPAGAHGVPLSLLTASLLH